MIEKIIIDAGYHGPFTNLRADYLQVMVAIIAKSIKKNALRL